MFSFIKQLFIVLLSFSSSLATVADQTKCLSLNDEPCMVELKYHTFIISLDKCNESCNVLSSKICVSEKTKDMNVKVFNMITNKNEAKATTKHISCDCKCKLNSSNQKWNNNTCLCECKNYHKCKEDYRWNSSTCICENSKYLKGIADTSVIECDEIIPVMDIVLTKMTNTIAATVSINCHSEKVKYKIDSYILHTLLLAIILLLIIVCYHYANYGSKEKGIDVLTI